MPLGDGPANGGYRADSGHPTSSRAEWAVHSSETVTLVDSAGGGVLSAGWVTAAIMRRQVAAPTVIAGRGQLVRVSGASF